MEKELFIRRVLKAALDAGIEAAEVYTGENDRFRASAVDGKLNDYSVSSRSGLSLRGLYQGRMGHSSTEAYDEDAVAMLVRGVIDSASLIEDEDAQEIYRGDASYPQIDNYAPALDQVGEADKLKLLLDMEEKALHCGDERITQVDHGMVSTTSASVRLVNTYGLELARRDNLTVAYVTVVAREGERVSTGMGFASGRDFAALSADKIAREAVDEALFYLNAAPVPSGSYRVIFDSRCMPDLMATFSGIFSADQAQKGLSLLAGREGETIAAPCVTLMDDPHLSGGFASSPFDDEGVATRVKAVIENGRLTTLLHNLKTARKAGVASTGNGSRSGYASSVSVSPSNFYFKPGEKTLAQLMEEVGDGLVITEVSGLHAGANPISGDFSLLSKGYTIENGKKGRAVEQITVAGNYYEMLKNIRAFASDLAFYGSPIGSPSVDVGVMTIAGK